MRECALGLTREEVRAELSAHADAGNGVYSFDAETEMTSWRFMRVMEKLNVKVRYVKPRTTRTEAQVIKI